MISPRRRLAIAALAASPLLLAGCQQPKPGVTVWSGTTSVNSEAICWQRAEGAPLSNTDCAADVLTAAAQGEGAETLEVRPGDTVGISVDPVVARGGWAIQVAGTTLASDLTETYYRFTFPETGADRTGAGYVMQVVANAAPSGTRGHWFFRLLPR